MVRDGDLQFDAELIRRQLDRILAADIFSAAKRSQMFLRYIVERTLLGSPPKEFEIAAEVLGRGADYDPETDATVRVEASRLRHRLREYYDTAGRQDPVFIQIPKGAYRAAFSAREDKVGVGATPPEAPAEGRAADVAVVAKPKRWTTRAVGAVVLAGVLGILLLATLWAARQRKPAAGPIHSLAVLPLQNLSGNAGEEYFVDGITDALTTELAHVPNLRVVSRTSARQEKGSRKPLRTIAAALGVDALVEGSVVRAGQRVHITAQLIDGRDERRLWAQSYDERIVDVVALQDKMAREIARQTQTTLAPSRSKVGARQVRPEAYDAYLRGLYFLHQRNVDKSVEYFAQAAALDASYGDAFAGLSVALTTRSVSEGLVAHGNQAEALAMAKRAIELDPESGEAYSALAFAEMNYARDWPAAGKDLERSLALAPNNPLTEMHYAIYLDGLGRPEEAVSHMRRALLLDPRSFLMNRHLGSTLYFARHYEEALRYLGRAEEMEPGSAGFVNEWRTRCYEMTARLDEAEQADLRQMSLGFSDATVGTLRRAYQRGGWKAYQRAKIALLGKQPRTACDLYEIGISYLRLGDADRAISWLAMGTQGRCFWADTLPVDPLVDGIRKDPRFASLLQMARLGSAGK